ncbi:MAG TPA: hypothetical protein VN864_07805 [Thermoplasmata archaeon]|nr:hypothetical protein [Thermoplasmata archaeon]
MAATLVEDLEQLPPGSHCLSFHSSEEEAARHAVSFLAGTPAGQDVRYWVRNERQRTYYERWLRETAPEHLGCVAVLAGEQVESDGDGHLRPVGDVVQFVREHPDGVTAGADTLSHYWSSATVPAHLEYESWFDRQPRTGSRFLCPYDLRRVPVDSAAQVMRELGAAHSDVVLSSSGEPGARLLQLFLFTPVASIPPVLDVSLGWAVRSGLVDVLGTEVDLRLTPAGDDVVRDWSARAILDW